MTRRFRAKTSQGTFQRDMRDPVKREEVDRGWCPVVPAVALRQTKQGTFQKDMRDPVKREEVDRGRCPVVPAVALRQTKQGNGVKQAKQVVKTKVYNRRVEKDIKRMQLRKRPMIAKTRFKLVVQDVLKEIKEGSRIAPDALEKLQVAAEAAWSHGYIYIYIYISIFIYLYIHIYIYISVVIAFYSSGLFFLAVSLACLGSPDPLRRFASEAGIDEGSESRGLCFARGFAAVALELLWTFAPDIPKTRSQVSVLREEEVQEFRFPFFTASRGQFLRIRTKVRRTEECERV